MSDPLGQTMEKPEVLMPALPIGPLFKGGLLPTRRALPLNFDNGSSGVEGKEEEVIRVEIFGRKKVWNVEEPEESPYSKMPELESYEERMPEQDKAMNGRKLDYLLRKNSRVWCGLPDAKWELGNIQSVSGDVADVRSSDGKVLEVPTENLLPANPDILDSVDDLIHLSFLNEPSVLHNLQCRYSHNMVYTKAGPVLVALNPFKEVSLYGNDFLRGNRQKLIDMPHVFSIADAAYNELMIDGKNQSIIISGESGAGKSETAKFAMQYLAALGGVSGIEDVLLHTNLILDSFGNAKTLINNNSSRFGKLIEIHFTAAGKICGANIQTFLLEKSRVVQIAMGERSYHVLYQLCAGAPSHLKEELNLKEAKEYEYLKQSNCLTIDNVDDAQRFNMLVEALDNVKICKEDQENAFGMLATVLWLGNIGFSVIDNENHVEVDLSEGITTAARLLGCDVSDLMLALSTHKLEEGNENISEKLTLSEAIDTRDALAKAIYACLFDWLVDQLNNSLEAGQCCSGRSISMLDIYGFESFQRNSFEQLCINYANERLQQHFNRHLFKLVQEEYSQNGIDWTIVDFVDNTECLDLFEKKPMGLWSLLDEESTFPKATDVTFVNKLKKHLSDSFCFKGERVGSFRICQFAGEVLYNSIGFLEKNRDLLHPVSILLLASCCSRLPQLFASHMHNQLIKPVSPLEELNGANSQKKSVGTKFKDQLFKLMTQLENTTPHFIRCIKPNSQHLPGIFDYDLVSQQLRYCSVVEVVQISRLGYPFRMTHQQFAERYGFFLLANEASQDSLSVSVNILQHLNILPDMYQVGSMKIFFRTTQMAALEEVRQRTLQGVLSVQKHFRGRHGRKNTKNLNYLKKSKDTEKEQPQVPHIVLEEFQERALKAEAALRLTEEENLTLKNQIQQYETRWSENEVKVKSMEEIWQKQLTSLQTSLAEAKKNLGAEDRESQPPRNDASQNNHNLDAEDTTKNEVSSMIKEFEQQKQSFEDEAKLITEENPGQSDMKPTEELQKLKRRCAPWKKDYKFKLRKTKVALGKLGKTDAVKPRKRWWDISRKKWWDIRRNKKD